MVDARPVEPLERPPDVEVVLPGSKSLTNRAALCAGLGRGASILSGVLWSDDTAAMVECLTALGAGAWEDRPGCVLQIEGIGGVAPDSFVDLSVRQSGTTARFLTPAAAAVGATARVDGAPQMRARPMADLFGSLRSLGADLTEEADADHLPVLLGGRGVEGGVVSVPGATSSQFLSGLLLAAPYFRRGLVVKVPGPLVSRPYVDMTVAMMERFGVPVQREGYREFVVPAGPGYSACDVAVEPDASAASYFFAAAAITRGRVRVGGLGSTSLQGDMAFLDVLEEMGAVVRQGPDWTEVVGRDLRGIDVDLSDLSDTAPTLAVVAACADSPTRVRNIGFIRHKESDRIGAVVAELNRLGVRAAEEEDGFTVHPGPVLPGEVCTYDDHRMAMAFAVLGLVAEGITILDPGCVAKTFPEYWHVLDGLRVPPAPA